MAAQEEWKDSVRIGDTVLFYAKEVHGYVCSQLARYAEGLCMHNLLISCLSLYSVCFPTAPTTTLYRYSTWICIGELPQRIPTSPMCIVSSIAKSGIRQSLIALVLFHCSLPVATFKVVAANKYKSQERLNELKKRFCAG